MLSKVAKRSSRVLPADLCTDHVHYAKNKRSTVFEKEQKHGGRRRDCSQYFWVTFLAETSKDLEIILITIVLSFTNSLSRTSLCFSLKTSFFYSNLFSLAKTQYYILVIRKLLILSMSLFSVWFFNLSSSSSGETCPARVGLRIYTAAVTLACVVQFQYQRTNAICEKSKEETRSLILKKQRFRI